MVTGRGTHPNGSNGVSTLYTLDASSGKMVQRGTVGVVCSGSTYWYIGFPDGQGPGKIARALTWNRVLSTDEIQAVATMLTTCKPDCKFISI